MKKIVLFTAALAMVAVMSKAADDVAVSETEISTTQTAEEPEYKDVNTDQAILESHKPLYHAPAPDAEKDFKYWAAAVGSRLKITGYAQGGYEAIFNNGSDNSNTFAMRRVILMVGANITPEFFAFFMHDFKSGNMQEYYMEYRPCKALNFRLGQSKNEFSMENPMSPTVVDLVAPMTQGVFWLNGSDPLMSNASGRDIGFTVYGDVLGGKLRYVAQVVNGGQINTADKNNQKNVIGKLEYKFMPNLRIGVSGVLGHGYSVAYSKYNPTLYNDDTKKGQTYRQNRWAVSGEWKSKKTGTDYYRNRCITVRGEVLGGMDGDVHSFGGYVSSSIPVYKQLDVVATVDNFNYNTRIGCQQTNFAGGVQLWLHTKCRLQLQYTYCALSSTHRAYLNKGNYSRIDAQVQVAF